MSLLLKFWPHLLAVIVLAGGVWWFSNARYQAGYDAATSAWQLRLNDAAEQGRTEVQKAFDKAREDEQRNRDQQRETEQKARDKHNEALTAAQAEARIWRDRYHKALSTDNTCSSWSLEPVPCPL